MTVVCTEDEGRPSGSRNTARIRAGAEEILKHIDPSLLRRRHKGSPSLRIWFSTCPCFPQSTDDGHVPAACCEGYG
jgi:hypothetical protein